MSEQDISRAMEAERLIAHPLLQEFFDTFRKEVFDRWENSPARDVEGREALLVSLKIAERVRTHLESIVSDGKIAQRTLTERLTGRNPSPF